VAERRARLDQPKTAGRALRPSYDPDAFGRWTERVARFLGTGRYLVVQTILIVIWVVVNTIPGIKHFDPYTFTFLTLILSLQAAYAAPLILLAQNRQDDRDRVNLDQDRDQDRQSKADLEYLVTRDFLRSELQRSEQREAREKDRSKPKADRVPKAG
jgi:uncharacterized membrane protein